MMNSNPERHGKCLCGATDFTLRLKTTEAQVCHCSMCRKLNGGGPLIAVIGELPEFTRKDDLRWYQSSDIARRGFCGKCGSSLFYQTVEEREIEVSVAALDDQGGITLKHHLYVDDKPDYYDFSGNEPRLTGAETRARHKENPK